MSYSTVGCVTTAIVFQNPTKRVWQVYMEDSRCGRLNEKCPPDTQVSGRLSPAGDAVWEVAVLEEVCRWQWLWVFIALPHFYFTLCSEPVVEGDLSASFSSCLLLCGPPVAMDSPLEIINPKNTSFRMFPWPWHLITAVEKKTLCINM